MFNLEKLADQIAEKIKPVLEETRKQHRLTLTANLAAQFYCASLIRGEKARMAEAVRDAKLLIDDLEGK